MTPRPSPRHNADALPRTVWPTETGCSPSLRSLGILPRSLRVSLARASCFAALDTPLERTSDPRRPCVAQIVVLRPVARTRRNIVTTAKWKALCETSP